MCRDLQKCLLDAAEAAGEVAGAAVLGARVEYGRVGAGGV